MATVVTTSVTRGTAVTVFALFTKPTRTSAKNGLGNITTVAATPTVMKVVWGWKGASKTTWTYGAGEITRLATGLYVWTIPTTTGATTSITGTVIGETGGCTAVGQWSIAVKSVTVP